MKFIDFFAGIGVEQNQRTAVQDRTRTYIGP